MKIYKQLAGQTVIYGLGTIVPRLLNYLLLTPFYTRIFIPEEYGIITEIYAYVAFLMVMLTYGMETTFFRFSIDEKSKKFVYNNALFSLFITSILFVIVIFSFTSIFAGLIGYESNSEYVRWFALIVALDAITAIPFAKLRQDNKALRFTFIKFINILVNVGFNIFFFVVCKNSSSEFLQSLYNQEIGLGYAFISNLIASFITFLLLIPEFLLFKFKFSWSVYKSMLTYSLPLLVVGLAGMVNEVADKIFLKNLTPEEFNPMKQVGIYGANYKIAVLMTIFIQMFKYAAEPFFFNQSKNIDAKVIYAKVMNYFIIFCLMIFLLVTLYMNFFKYFIDSSYFIGLHIVPIILLANIFLGIYYNLSVWYKVNNLTKYGALFSLIGMLITVVINVIFIPKYGFLASAWATFSCYFIMMVLSYYFGRNHYKINYSYFKFLTYFILALTLYFIKSRMPFTGITDFGFASFIYLIFIAAVVKIEKITFKDLKSLIKN